MIQVSDGTYAGYRTIERSVAGSGPTVVLLHGFGHSSQVWQPILARCAETGVAAVAVDLPGFGAADSYRPGPRMAQLDQFVRDLVVRHSSVAPVLIVGNSLGGLLAVRAGAGDHVAAIMPIGTAGFGWDKTGAGAAAAVDRTECLPITRTSGVPEASPAAPADH